MNKSIFIFLFSSFQIISQDFQNINQTVSQAGSFSVKIETNLLNVFNGAGKNVFTRKFIHPSGIASDLDLDGIDELIVIDSIFSVTGEALYKIFFFNTLDTFYLIDSINSGKMYPYFQINSETDEVIIVTGNSDFDKYNTNPEFFFSPVNCWKFENSEVFLNNEEMFEFFIAENEGLIEFIEDYNWQADSCASSKEILGAVASVYVNFINAGEKVKAAQFLKKYYRCSDFNQLKKEFQKLLESPG
jgi:hypothetical protein